MDSETCAYPLIPSRLVSGRAALARVTLNKKISLLIGNLLALRNSWCGSEVGRFGVA